MMKEGKLTEALSEMNTIMQDPTLNERRKDFSNAHFMRG